MSQKQFWRLQRVLAETGLCRSVVYELMAKGEFPKSFKITGRAAAWASDEVEAWKASRLAARAKEPEAA